MDTSRRIKALGEASIRVKDLGGMCRFYEEVLGLAILRREDSFVFFRIADGYAGHPQVLNLFIASNHDFHDSLSTDLDPAATTLHHIAFNIALDDYEPERQRLTALGVPVQATTHPWLHVRSLYFPDPEGNLLEFVARDDSVQ